MKKLGLILLVLSSLLSNYNAKAQPPIIGNDISWTCVGQDSFLIKLVVFRDCNSITLGAYPITFKCAATGATITSISISVGTPVDITPVCNSSCSRCSNTGCSFPYGMHKYSMQGIVTLNGAGSCCNIVISYEFSQRSWDITTGASGLNYYFEAKLNRCLSPCDNSPTFTNSPVVFLCNGQDFTYNHGAIDSDLKPTGGLADSLTYEWAEPLETAGSGIAYTGSYTYDKPIYFWGFPNTTQPFPKGLHLDPYTGDIQFRPTQAEVTVMVLRVNEFRNGVKIAEIRRDLTIWVINCPSNNPPLVTTPSNVRSKSVFPGDTVTFNFSTSDANTNDSVTLSWNNAIPGATWTATNGQSKNPTATLTWIPNFPLDGSLPYNFTVTAKDNACPLRAQFTQSYQIFVSPVPIINIDPIAKRCINGSIIILNDFVTVNGKRNTKGIWSSPSAGLISGDTFDPAVAGVSYASGWKVKYEYTDSASGRYNKDSAYVIINPLPKPNAGKDDTVCTGAKISLSGLPSSTKASWRGTGIEGSYPNWKLNPDASGIVNGGIYDLIYHYIDANQCENEDTARITVFKTLPSDAGTDMEFCIDGISQTLTGLPAGGSWTGNGVAGNVFYPSLAKVGVHDLKYTYTNVICSSTDTAKYSVWDLPLVTAATLSGDTIFCRTEGLIPLNGQPSVTGGVWSGPGVNGNNFNTYIGADVISDYTLRYEFTDSNKCKNSADLKVTIAPEPVIVIDQTADGDYCTGNPFSIWALYKHSNGVSWWKGSQSDGTIIGNPDSSTIIYKPGINDMLRLYFWLYVRTTHVPNYVCSPAYDSIKILKSAMPAPNFTANPTSGGLPLTVQFTDSSTIIQGTIQIREWKFGDGNVSTDQNPLHTYQNPGTYTVQLKVVSDAGCENTLIKADYINTTTGIETLNGSVKIKFYPNPAHCLLFVEYSGYEPANLILTDILGNTVLEKKIIPLKNEISLLNYKPGIYFIFLDGVIAGKLMIE